MSEQPTPDQERAMEDFLKHKTGVFVAIPNLGAAIGVALSNWTDFLAFKTLDMECPWFFRVYKPNDLTPVEYARNECVREFLADKRMKRLWFIDADTNPPGNALDLLDFDEPMVSAQTHIWMNAYLDGDGFYKHPIIKANAFKWRRDLDDFLSIVPANDGKPFYCDATGAASLVIKREVIEDMPEPWFRTVRDPYGKMKRSEDLDFTKRATDRRHQLLYVPQVTFGHLKHIDVKQIVRYGTAAMRDIIRKVKAADDLEKLKASLPDIEFAGERPAVQEEAAPRLEVISGGARG
jgi:hypothetical protein